MEGVIKLKNMFGLEEKYLQNIEEKFNLKKNIAKEREKELFSVFNEKLTEEEEFALKFLYAYMPLNDLADYSGEFFLNHIRKIFSIKNKVSWGSKIPHNTFIHFVLPYRVNNENIENFVDVIFEEVYPRVKDLSMYDAVLEINHWCHEKATYTGSDIRTVSPLTLMRTAIGRCGEQSTLLVAALRSLCIPARQCYTPLWAHCDSNHAWVEAFAEGKWYFLGACEPDPKLNMGWFTGPARRAMLVNTRVAGNYPGPEEITLAHEWYTEINLLDNYAKNKKITVKVIDEQGKPAAGARVNFELYNFAQFSPILKLTTDSKGEVSASIGYGDILIHAVHGNSWGFNKISVSSGDTFEIFLESKLPEDGVLEFEMVPPPEIHEEEVQATDEERKINDLRLKEEDKIRTAFENTFIQEEEAKEIAEELKLPTDRVWRVIKNAKGNSWEIAAFLKEQTPKFGELPLKLLESLREKDLTDTFRPVLIDHLINSVSLKNGYEDNIFVPYIMCPRVNFEMLGAYRGFFQNKFSAKEIKAFKEDPKMLVKWIRDNIEILEGYNHYIGYSAPKGSFELKKCDTSSRHILFVAMARSFGIPARLEPSDKRPQYLQHGIWKGAALESSADSNSSVPMGIVKLEFKNNSQINPEYSSNFSLARFENGAFKNLDYWDKKFSYFENGFEVLAGNYRLTTGIRLPNGTALVKFTYFTVEEEETTVVEMVYPGEKREVKVYGHLPSNYTIALIDGKNEILNESIKDNGAVIAFMEPDREPTKHILRELRELSKEFNNWCGNIYLIVGEDKLTSSFNLENYKELPEKTKFAIDKGYKYLDCFTEALENNVLRKYPLVFAVNKNGEIIYQSVGYKLGIANDVLSVLKA